MVDDNVAQWRRLADQARAGELYLDDELAALQCFSACDKRLTEINELRVFARNAQNVSGFGDFDMADKLVGKFLKQATGDPNSIDQIIQEHIETVKNMREVMAISFKRITGQDIENATQITNTTDQVG
ncbi:hypothetical protein [Nocardia gipuzkoensis]|uniref:hypothetical protein n=1 Tax=Nocardia gipuzkoensis TaxID=2749991 RepID=UPI0015EF46C7|nr:hypothetical protein [Nocardia gipuzkoensis]